MADSPFQAQIDFAKKQKPPTTEEEQALIFTAVNKYCDGHCALLKSIIGSVPEHLETYLRYRLGESNSTFTPGSTVER